jgi:Methyltransferase domain.
LTGDNLPKQSFDLVYTQMTLHHVADFKEMLELFHQMLEPGGWLCIADLDKEDGSFHGEGFDGHNGFDRQELEMAAAGVGFGQVGFSTIFEMVKAGADGVVRNYPLFLMSCQKNGVN